MGWSKGYLSESMNLPLGRTAIVWFLLIYLLFINGFMAAPSVGHAAHHAKHQAGTHSTGLCAWQCAAGQGIETVAVVLSSSLQFVDMVEARHIDRVQTASPVSRFFRGPPAVLG